MIMKEIIMVNIIMRMIKNSLMTNLRVFLSRSHSRLSPSLFLYSFSRCQKVFHAAIQKVATLCSMFSILLSFRFFRIFRKFCPKLDSFFSFLPCGKSVNRFIYLYIYLPRLVGYVFFFLLCFPQMAIHIGGREVP